MDDEQQDENLHTILCLNDISKLYLNDLEEEGDENLQKSLESLIKMPLGCEILA